MEYEMKGEINRTDINDSRYSKKQKYNPWRKKIAKFLI